MPSNPSPSSKDPESNDEGTYHAPLDPHSIDPNPQPKEKTIDARNMFAFDELMKDLQSLHDEQHLNRSEEFKDEFEINIQQRKFSINRLIEQLFEQKEIPTEFLSIIVRKYLFKKAETEELPDDEKLILEGILAAATPPNFVMDKETQTKKPLTTFSIKRLQHQKLKDLGLPEDTVRMLMEFFETQAYRKNNAQRKDVASLPLNEMYEKSRDVLPYDNASTITRINVLSQGIAYDVCLITTMNGQKSIVKLAKIDNRHDLETEAGIQRKAIRIDPAVPEVLASRPDTMHMTFLRSSRMNQEREGANALPFILQLMKKMQKMHEGGIIHRDINPNNVRVLASGEPVIIDYGLARQITPASSIEENHTEGTLKYLPLESLNHMPGDTTISSEKTDVYGVGCILFHLLTKKSWMDRPSVSTIAPQEIQKLSAYYKDIQQKYLDDPKKLETALAEIEDEKVRSIVRGFLHPDIKKRFTSAEAVQKLEEYLESKQQ
ncbi:MAG: protein kinase [Candidatus Peribacteraceae bacterium]|nr:protein kinase [Candidatus Peribacteraceae bacterium]